MNRSPITHGIYALITMGMFVIGSQWERPSESDGADESATASGDRANGLRSTPFAGQVPGTERRTKSGKEGDSATDENDRLWTTGGTEPAEVDLSALLRVAKGKPLTKKQIEALVLAAIKSRDPVERRKAFDRILEEMRSDTFSVAQAMAIRMTMHENGASGEQWRLFDYAWGANDPAAALANIERIPDQYLAGFLGNMIPGLASVDAQAAVDLFAGLDPKLQATIRKRLFEGLVDNDVAVATEHIYDATDPGSYNWRPMDELTREIVKEQGLEATLEWASGLPEGPLRGSAWSAAYAHWGGRAPEAAVQSIIDMPQSHDRNQAINGFISTLAHQDGEAAVIWAAEITEPGMRTSALVRAGRQYYQQDQQGATRWLVSSGLPESTWPQVVSHTRDGG